MNRILKSALIAGLSALVVGATAARADDHLATPIASALGSSRAAFYTGPESGFAVQLAGWGDRAGEERELDASRHQFYSRWRGDRHERDRFESWYSRRHEEMRRRYQGRGRRDHERSRD
jgi:hypothetical protein